jgi:hypothetical protein
MHLRVYSLKENPGRADKLSEGATLELVVPYLYVVLNSGIAVLISIKGST